MGPTWVASDTEVKKESLDSQQNVRHTQTEQACAHLPAEAKHFIGELCVHGDLQQDMQIDEHVVPAKQSKDSVEVSGAEMQSPNRGQKLTTDLW